MRRSRRLLPTVLVYGATLLALVFFIGPIAWFFALAIRPPETAFVVPPQIVFEPRLDAFRHILLDPGTNAPQLFNSIVVAGCTVRLWDGASVEIDAPDLMAMRREVVEMLFAEGNHNCPSCEKSGRCDLQAVAAETGMLASEFPYRYPRRETDPGDARLWLARDRCILCQRCVELVRDDAGQPVFTLSGRGPGARVELDHERADGLSEEQVDAAVDLCPVGAILRKGVGYDDPMGARRYDTASIRERALRGEPR